MQRPFPGSADISFNMAQTFLCLDMQFGTGFDNLDVQGSVEAGSSERSIPTLAAIPCPIFTGISNSAHTKVQVAIKLKNLQGNRSSCRLGKISPQSVAEFIKFIMPPRSGHKVPRRGGHSGQKSDTRNSGQSSPKRISPLACASPPSGDSTHSDDLSNTVQIATFHYRRLKNKPVVKASITVIFDEEDEEEESCKNDMGEKTSTTSENSSKSKDNSYNLDLQSRIEEDSTLGYSAEQEEALKELRSLKRKEPMDSSEGTLEAHVESHHSKPTPTQSGLKNEEEEDSFDYALYLKLPPGYDCIEDVPEGVEVTCEPDPVRAAEDRKKRAMEREAEAKKSQNK